MERAVNLADLTKYADRGSILNPVMLLLRPILTRQVVHCEGDRFDGDALVVQADIEDDRWEAIKTILRDGLGRREGIPKYALRIYETGKITNKTWKRV
jgi:hypothetical protein